MQLLPSSPSSPTNSQSSDWLIMLPSSSQSSCGPPESKCAATCVHPLAQVADMLQQFSGTQAGEEHETHSGKQVRTAYMSVTALGQEDGSKERSKRDDHHKKRERAQSSTHRGKTVERTRNHGGGPGIVNARSPRSTSSAMLPTRSAAR